VNLGIGVMDEHVFAPGRETGEIKKMRGD